MRPCIDAAKHENSCGFLHPYSFDEASPRDPAIMDMAKRIKITAAPCQDDDDISSTVEVTLKDDRRLRQRVTEFLGTPGRPLTGRGMQEKFRLLTQKYPAPQMNRIYERVQNLEAESNLDWLRV